VGAWASPSPAPNKHLDVPHTTTELRSESICSCVRRPNICTGPASSARVVWALVFSPDYLRFTDPIIVFPDPSVDTQVPRTAPCAHSHVSVCSHFLEKLIVNSATHMACAYGHMICVTCTYGHMICVIGARMIRVMISYASYVQYRITVLLPLYH